jgi:hypothetical protein
LNRGFPRLNAEKLIGGLMDKWIYGLSTYPPIHSFNHPGAFAPKRRPSAKTVFVARSGVCSDN